MTTNELISWIVAIGAIGAAIGAFWAAIAAWKATHEAKKTLQAQLVIDITDAYAAPEMLDAMKELRAFERKYCTKSPEEFLKERNKDSDEGKRLDHCRRRVSHHFVKILRMKRLKLIDDSFVKEVAPPIQAQFLFEVIEPLQRIINLKYDTSMFDMFRKIYPDLSKAGRIA